MYFTHALSAALLAATSVLASPISSLSPRQALTDSSTGESNGFYYSFWTDGSSDAAYTNGEGGSYSVTWSNNQGNWVGGKGWSAGSAR
jgi:endo-1,4-beta-xylanase